MELDPAVLSQQDRYKLLIGAVIPRPIALVSTRSADGRLNVAPFSFFAGVGSAPMSVLFCPANNSDGSEKDTLRNAKPVSEGGVGEFVVNIVSEAIERRMAACAEPAPYGQSEFEISGLTAVASRRVSVPRVDESPVSFECRTLQLVRLAPGAPGGANIVIGEVVHVHARDGVVDERYRVDPAQVAAIGRLGGQGYCRTHDRFEMPQGVKALQG